MFCILVLYVVIHIVTMATLIIYDSFKKRNLRIETSCDAFKVWIKNFELKRYICSHYVIPLLPQ
jgi:hypothetical protein